MRKVMALFLFVIMSTSLVVPAFANTNTDELINTSNMTKSEFADYCDNLATPQSRSASAPSIEEITDLLGVYSMSSGAERESLEATLNAAGCYIYTCGSTTENQIVPYSQPSDVTMGDVAIAYIPFTQQWVVGFSGSWSSILPIGYEVFSPIVSVYVGEHINVGGLDAAGIVFYNTSGTAPSMVSSLLKFTDYSAGGEGLEETSDSPSTFNSAQGIGYLYQDEVIITALHGLSGSPEYSYMGRTFVVSITYDSSFEQFNGSAKGFYYHTWDTTSITGIGFTVGATEFGINISWQNEGNSFPAYSNSDTQF